MSQEKLTESNFTLGALSPDTAELIGELDPVLGSIVAPVQPTLQRPVVPTFGSLLSDGVSDGSPRDQSLNDTDFDLVFYFGGNDSRPEDDDAEVNKVTRPGSSAAESSSSIDALSEQLEASLEDMIQTAQMHPRSLQVGEISSLTFMLGLII